ncbi:hypothetical protein CAL7716_101350 (plasmid) [Calothrix sp. PCC 7716]|nr:hypothetical protein CAL7716_101350 [Calothrix sp. PCC 7716]
MSKKRKLKCQINNLVILNNEHEHNMEEIDLNFNSVTLSILKQSFQLYEYKKSHSCSEYRIFLELREWTKGSAKERRAIRVAKALYNHFSYCPQALASIEPKVLYSLAQSRYEVVIDALSEYPVNKINQDLVLKLMRDARKQDKKENQKLPLLDRRSQVYLQEIASITNLSIEQVLANAISEYHSKTLVEKEVKETKGINVFQY